MEQFKQPQSEPIQKPVPKEKVQAITAQIDIVQANTVQANTVQANTVQANTVQAITIQANTIQANTIQANTIQTNTVQTNKVGVKSVKNKTGQLHINFHNPNTMEDTAKYLLKLIINNMDEIDKTQHFSGADDISTRGLSEKN